MTTTLPSPISTEPDLDDGVVRVDLAARQLERLADADDGVDALDDAELVDELGVDVAEDGDDVPLFAVDAVVLEAQLSDDCFWTAIDLCLGCARFHYYDHLMSPRVAGGVSAPPVLDVRACLC